MSTVNRIKKSNTTIPHTLTEADAVVGKIGTIQSQIDELTASVDLAINELKEELRKKLEPLKKDRTNLLTSIFAYAESHKEDLTEEKKSIELTHGTIGWRLTPPSVALKVSDAEMLDTLKERGLDCYIRIKEELDRQALIADRDMLPRLKGLSFVQKEEFFVKPNSSSEVEKTRTIVLD